jgi:hypothetical protein
MARSRDAMRRLHVTVIAALVALLPLEGGAGEEPPPEFTL